MRPLRVLVVDDSAVVRQGLTALLERDPGISVIAAVPDPLFAMTRMQSEWPDVIVLDVEMPRMDGLTFLRRIMEERPTPVVICSTLTSRGASTTMDALAAGAAGIVAKPKLGLKRFFEDATAEIVGAVRTAAQADARRLRPVAAAPPAAVAAHRAAPASSSAPRPPSHALSETTERIVAIGTSTGGTQALERVLTALPAGCPGIAVVQHMPERFTAAFAERLDRLCEITVCEAAHGQRLLPGHALIAPGGKHLAIRRSGGSYYADVQDGPLVNRHKPSVDVLFRSVARHAGANALGIIMTGMGDDGARGLREMRDAGAQTLAQDEASCVVFGMPKEAIRLDAAMRVLPLDSIAGAIVQYQR